MRKRYSLILPVSYLLLLFVITPPLGRYGEFVFYLGFPLSGLVSETVKYYCDPTYIAFGTVTVQYFLIGLAIDWILSKRRGMG